MQALSLRSVLALVLALSTAAAAYHRPPFGARTPAAAFGWSKRRTATVPTSAASNAAAVHGTSETRVWIGRGQSQALVRLAGWLADWLLAPFEHSKPPQGGAHGRRPPPRACR